MFAVPHSIHLAHIAGSDEGLRISASDEFHHLGEFFLREQSLYLFLFLSAVSAHHLIEAASSLEILDYELAYGLVL